MKKWLAGMMIAAALACAAAAPAQAFEPYNNYTYDIRGEAQGEPQAYLPTGILNGESAGAGPFVTPKDIFISPDRKLYVADTGNNRIVVLSELHRMEYEIRAFDNAGTQDTFNRPQGVFVTPDNRLYVADTGNGRIVVFNPDRTLLRVIGRPDSALLDGQFAFSPLKIAVDSARRLYVASKNVTQGVIELDDEGAFVSFIGAVPVKLNLFEALWRLVATRQQKDRMLLTVPTEYNSIDIDGDGFVYGVVSAVDAGKFTGNMFIRKLNPMGSDVLKRNGFFPPMGDVEYHFDAQKGEYEISLLTDVAVRPYGIYSVLDARKGRIFTYNSNGDLMYVFGALGRSLGQFGLPEALDTLDRRVYVADSKYNQIVMFEPTRYGQLITEAIEKYAVRDFDASNELWLEALKYTSKSDLAFGGVGKAMTNKERSEEAMRYLRYAGDRKNYSTAFENFRNEVIDRHFTGLAAGAALLAALVILRRIYKRRKAGKMRHDS